MNGGEWLVDTNIIIYLVSGDRTVSDLLEDKSIYLSLITKIELFAFKKLKSSEEEVIKAVIEHNHVIFASYDTTKVTIKFRRKYNLKLADAIIAASAETHNLPFVAADTDFNRVPRWIWSSTGILSCL